MTRRKHFTFKTDNGLKRIEKILDAVKIEDVAKEFVMKAKKCTFAQAQKWLEKTYNIKK